MSAAGRWALLFGLQILTLGPLRAATRYVDVNAPSPTPPYTNWTTAATTIQTAIDAAAAGDTILVTNGVYAPISTANEAITIRSVNGAEATVIDGGGTARCATLGSANGNTNTVLTGFTLRNGRGTGSFPSGGGASYGTLHACVLTRNTSFTNGGGASDSVLNDCLLTQNTGSLGGGASFSVLNNCILTGNSAGRDGGGAYGGTLNNCTLSGNRALNGGGAFYGTLNNCIVWGNRKTDGTMDNYSGSTVRYSCTQPPAAGTGNISADPRLVDAWCADFRLRAESPCLDAGANAYAVGATDFAGNPRIRNGVVDMGCYEGAVTGHVITVRVIGAGGVEPGVTQVVGNGGSVAFTAQPGPRPFLHFLTNGVFATAAPDFTWTNVVADGTLTVVYQIDTYVDAARPDDAGDGLTWATAKRTLQAAIDASLTGDTIWVTNGVYAPVTTGNKTITIRGVNGAEATIIDGGGSKRCATLGSYTETNTVLVGVTLKNGKASTGGGSYGGTLHDCILTGNVASGGYGQGGGAYYGRLIRCALRDNRASSGGGAYGGTLDKCTISANTASGQGGGAYNGVLSNCTLWGNAAGGSGGGAAFVTLNNCSIAANTAPSGAGVVGSSFDSLNNCIVWGNRTPDGETNNYSTGIFRYSCARPLPSGVGNLDADPRFMDAEYGDLRLREGSPCLDAGNNIYTSGSTDLLGNPRIQDGAVDMGACEGAAYGHVIRLRVIGVGRVDPDVAQCVADGGSVTFSALPGPRPILHFLTNGVIASLESSFTWTNVHADGTLTAVFGELHVDANRTDDSGDGLSWATAKRTIQAGVNAAFVGETVWVTNGVYASIATTNKAVTIQSVNGAARTVIDGGRTQRCATLGTSSTHTNTLLVGFTLRNGRATSGGGVSYGTLNACVLCGNTVTGDGGGAYYGVLSNCTLTGNEADSDGGGAYYSILNNCTVSGNSAYERGSGVCYATLNNCIVWDNRMQDGATSHHTNSTFRYSCALPLPPGTGNIAADPRFVDAGGGDYRLRPGSPCIDAGDNGSAVGPRDVLGNPRIVSGRVDMGATEGTADGHVIVVRVDGVGRVDPGFAQTVADGGSATFTAEADPRPFRHFLTNGIVASTAATYTWENVRADGTLTAVFQGQAWYVDAARPVDTGDGLSWATARRSIQSAIDSALAGDTIWVADGVYSPITTANKAITIRSVNGAATTAIDGGGQTRRCAALGRTTRETDTALIGFTLRNATDSSGAGSFGGTLSGCVLTGNTAYMEGGGAAGGILNNCTIMENVVSYFDVVGQGGGAFRSTLNNCTLTGNAATETGGGTYACVLNNCILWGNQTTSGAEDNYFTGTFAYSCTRPLPPGEGNIVADPRFVDVARRDVRLRPGSPCIDAGANRYAVGATDLRGALRIRDGVVDMGAYEGAVDGLVVLVEVRGVGRVAPPDAQMVEAGGSLTFTAQADVRPFSCFLTNGVFATAAPVFTWENVRADGTLTAVFEAWTWYVDGARPDDSGDGLSWPTAKRTIQAGVNAAVAGDTVLVTNGVYAPISTDNKAITIRSVNGAAATIIDGGRTTRCATLGTAVGEAQTVLVGVTLRNGWDVFQGGGVFGGVLSNCTLSANLAYDSPEYAAFGGGAFRSMLNDCTLSGNLGAIGGGAFHCTLNHCVLTGNRGEWGGGAEESTLRACVLSGNTATELGGGACGGILTDCTVTANSVGSGSGDFGGGVYDCVLHNSIVWGNHGSGGTSSNYARGVLVGCCTTPLPAGEGNIDADPLFADPGNANFRLSAWSSCVDAGLNDASMAGTTDLDGNPRIFNGTVDIGAYEFTMTTVATGLLAGAFRPAGGMRTELAAHGLMPGVSPYAADTAAAQAIPTNAVDWVLLELARTNDLKTIAARSALLLTDGRTLGTGGGEGVRLECAPGWYYLKIKHRNHLAVMSAQPVAYTNAVIAYDFTTGPDTVAGGTNACVELAPGIWGMIAGDCDGDGKITPVDRAIVSNQHGRAGYLAGDLNLDGKVNAGD